MSAVLSDIRLKRGLLARLIAVGLHPAEPAAVWNDPLKPRLVVGDRNGVPREVFGAAHSHDDGELVAISWNKITDLPVAFPPVAHTHAEYALQAHTHLIADTTGLQAALDGKAASSHTHAWSDLVSGIPATFPPPAATTTVLGGVKVGSGLAISAEGVLSAAGQNIIVTTGAAPAFAITPDPPFSSLAAIPELLVKFHANGTLGSNTITINGLGPLNLVRYAANGAKVPADVKIGCIHRICYDGADAVVQNPLSTPGPLGPQSGALSGDFTLTANHIGRLQILGGTGLTVTLPVSNSIPSGACFVLKNEGTGRATITLNSNSILDCPSLSIERGETITLQSDGGSTYRLVSRTSRGLPNYGDVASSGHAFGTVYQVDSDSTILGLFSGSYMNGARLFVGPTSSPSINVGQLGDDINSNTKAGWISAQIPKGWYFKWDNTMFSGGFETIYTAVYRNH